jgi:hypothetical protein
LYPGGPPPIGPDFVQIYLETAQLSQLLREKWGSAHPMVQGFDKEMEALSGKDEGPVVQNELAQRVLFLMMKAKADN